MNQEIKNLGSFFLCFLLNYHKTLLYYNCNQNQNHSGGAKLEIDKETMVEKFLMKIKIAPTYSSNECLR